MMPDQVAASLAIYIRLISYPAAIIGVIWLMLFRADWRRRLSSLFYVSQAFLLLTQWITVMARIFIGTGAIAAVSDVFITPALVIFNVSLWTSIMWLARRWRHDPHLWI